jgi:hypothetical protein
VAAERLDGLDGAQAPPDSAALELGQVLADIIGRNPGQAARWLALDGIGFVLVGDYEGGELMAAFDAAPGLVRVSKADEQVMWRVAPAEVDLDGTPVDEAARLHVVGEAGAFALDTGSSRSVEAWLGRDKAARAQGDGKELRLVLAERADPRWQATLNGRPLAADQGDGWQQGFALPADASGRIVITWRAPWWPTAVQVVVLALTVVLALPLRRVSASEEDG